jgi:hypothetical protein
MLILEDAKRTIERITGRRPDAADLDLLTQDRKAHLLHFKDDGDPEQFPFSDDPLSLARSRDRC